MKNKIIENIGEKTIVVVSGPSGTGKSTIVDYMVSNKKIKKLTTYTTRIPRPKEVEGVSYFFVTKEKFKNVDKVEEVNFCDNFYGLGKKELYEGILKNEEVIVILESQGVQYMKELYPNNIIVIYIDVDKELMAERMNERGDDLKDIENRLQKTEESNEFDVKNCADYIIYNDDLEKSLEKVDEIVDKFRQQRKEKTIKRLEIEFKDEVKKIN